VVVVGYGTQKKVNLSGAVETISSKLIESRPVTNANLALQGAAPNLNIAMNDGRSTTAPEINIRGFTSINGGSAFILIDNVPVTAQELSRINPADIESVSVLEDAAAAAIYGARAAFGVVLITTRTAKSDKLVVDADVNYGLKQIYGAPEFITDPYLFMQYTYESGYPLRTIFTEAQRMYAKRRSEDPSLPEIIMKEDGANWDYYASTNWVKKVYAETSSTYNANMRVAQKSERLTYTMSGGYCWQDGILKVANDVMRRYNFRGNGTYKFTDWWKVGSNVSFVSSKYDAPTFIDYGLYQRLYYVDAVHPMYNPDGSLTEGGAFYGLLTEGGRSVTHVNETQVSLHTTVDILKDVWNIKADANFRRSNENMNRAFVPSYYRLGPELPLRASGMEGTGTGTNSFARVQSAVANYTVLNIYTDFHKTFADRHYVQALVGFNQEYLYSDYNWTQKQLLISNNLPTLQLATGTLTAGQTIDELALQGVFFRLNYIFNNKYILEFNGRDDGSSRYPKNNRWGVFPSGSAAWVVSKENFFSGMNEVLHISNLKLRGSYGSLGNQVNSSYYPYIPTMSSKETVTVLDGVRPYAAFQPGTVSSSLTWETVRTLNGGIELGLFDKFDLKFDLYTRHTEGMLTKSRTLPGIYGAAEPNTNAADLKTKGWGLNVGYRDEMSAASSPLSFEMRAMLSDSRSYITRYDNPDRLLSDYYIGQEVGEIWGLVNAGFFQSQEELDNWPDQRDVGSDDMSYLFYVGDLKYKDLNNDGRITYGKSTVDDPGDRKVIGNTNPRYLYSFMANATWKGFDLRIFFQGVGKKNWYPAPMYHTFWGIFASPWVNANPKNLDHWTPETPNAYFPRVKQYIAEDATELGAPQSEYLQDASYLRLKNLTLGYTLPNMLTEKWNVTNLRFYLSGENIWTPIRHIAVSEIDPETVDNRLGFTYPHQRVWSFGLNLSF
jgi:TonB-linked SusC/RagA family outer membrane protein